MGLRSALVADANRRRSQQERAAAPPLQELAARNAVIQALSGLGAPQALAVIKSVEKSLIEYLTVQASTGL